MIEKVYVIRQSILFGDYPIGKGTEQNKNIADVLEEGTAIFSTF